MGVNDKTIQAIVRHSDVSTTMNIYVKTVSNDSTTTIKLLEAALCVNCAPPQVPENQDVVN